MLADSNKLSCDWFHPTAYGNICRDPYPNIGRSSGSFVKELEEGVKYLKRIGIPKEEQI